MKFIFYCEEKEQSKDITFWNVMCYSVCDVRYVFVDTNFRFTNSFNWKTVIDNSRP